MDMQKGNTKKTKSLTYTVELEDAIKKIAVKENRSVNGQIVFILEQFVAASKGWPVEMERKKGIDGG